MRSEGFFTYSRGAYTNFLHEERKMRRLFFARRAYSSLGSLVNIAHLPKKPPWWLREEVWGKTGACARVRPSLGPEATLL